MKANQIVNCHGLKFKLLYEEEQIITTIRLMAQKLNSKFVEIREKDPEAKIVLLGIMNGAFMFFSDIIKNIKVPVLVEFIKCKSYVGEKSGELNIIGQPKWDLLKDAYVLIVDDICDTGNTLALLAKQLQHRGAKQVESAVLVQRPEKNHRISPTYCGLTCSAFIIGYGLDYNECGRQYPCIYQKLQE